ncbi:MAG: hypothetical protein HQL22_00395 [Candidatus Omnitrophica bacterium]|nr:hypothetical protein [Candidatus Omnitrophota bacterium]
MVRNSILMLAMLSLVGCASLAPVKYSLGGDLYKGSSSGKVLLVSVLKDTRPEAEHTGQKSGNMPLYTGDGDFKPDVALQISQQLADHLKSSGLFNTVILQRVNDDLDTEAMQKLSDQGIDYVLVGNINHFFGYQSAVNGAGSFFGALGVTIEAMANPKTAQARSEYTDLKMIDLKQHKILWQGDVEYSFEKKVTFYDGAIAYSLQGLKEVNNKLARQLDEALKSEAGQ